MAVTVETTNYSWQVQQIQEQIGEWIELKLAIASNSNVSGIVLPNLIYNFLVVLAWIIFSLSLYWLGFLLYKLVQPYFFEWWSRRIGREGQLATIPIQLSGYSVDRWLKKAKSLQLEGNYTEACRALYMGMLQLLSDRALIPLEVSRTDGEYRHLIADFSQPQAYQTLLNTHEQLCFSDRNLISSEIFHTCLAAYSEIDRQIINSQT